MTKAQIYERLWPSTFVSEVTVSRLVFEVRRALQDAPEDSTETAGGTGIARFPGIDRRGRRE